MTDEWLLEQLYIAYRQARRGKSCTSDAHAFEMNEFSNLCQLRDDIMRRNYHPSPGIAFISREPVIREIFAAPFRDRIVHHFLYNMVADWWDKRMIYGSYSCRKGKGTLFGVQRLDHHIRQVTGNYARPAYVIKLDVRGYFMSLPRDGLYKRIIWGLDRQFPERGELYRLLKYLWKEIIFDDPTQGVIQRGPYSEWRKLPASKSLFCQPPGRGIVIGNLSSQLLSNIYLDLLDRFITLQLGYKHYGRYVDDFFIIVPEEDFSQALNDIGVIEEFLADIGLTLHPNKRYIQRVEKGVPFLGAKVYNWHIVPGDRLIKNMRKAVLTYGVSEADERTLNSYLGHMKHLNSKKICCQIFWQAGWEAEIGDF